MMSRQHVTNAAMLHVRLQEKIESADRSAGHQAFRGWAMVISRALKVLLVLVIGSTASDLREIGDDRRPCQKMPSHDDKSLS